MTIREITTEKGFTDSITLEYAKEYLEDTLQFASRMKIDLTWGFDEAQADSFHRSWTGDKFIQCIEKVLQEKNNEV